MSVSIPYYRPQQIEAKYLEAILVGREPLVGDIMTFLKDFKKSSSKNNYLIIGPRGIGKTFLTCIIENRINNNKELKEQWIAVIFSEESYGIKSFADLLIEALNLLSSELKDADFKKAYNNIRYEDDDEKVVALSLDALRGLHRKTNKSILFIIENVDRIFEKQMKEQRNLHLFRKTLIEEDWLITICTSPTYLNAIKDPEKPLFEFFNVKILKELNTKEQIHMLKQINKVNKNKNFSDYLKGYYSRIRAIYHFTGGNPRLIVMLYELISNQKISEIKSEINLLLDQLTPFYQDRMKDISQLEGKIIETMSLLPEGTTPTEIAKEARIEAKKVRAILTRLERAGYIRKEKRKKKQTIYIIPERFFRIWHQMNHSRAARKKIQYLFEFFSSWYSTKEERNEIWRLKIAFETGNISIVEKAIDFALKNKEIDKEQIRPYIIALDFIKSSDDSLILERQHLEMREAVKLIIDAFDNAS
jgi:uncharacterized protein